MATYGAMKDGAEEWVRSSLLVRECEALRREILLHKWYESERAGYDIGWERAAVDWQLRFGIHRARRRTGVA